MAQDDPTTSAVYSPSLRLAHTLRACTTLGPGRRGVLWVAGCARHCPGCIAAPLQSAAGKTLSVAQVVELVLQWPGIEGLTFSGGEPFEQAGPLADLCATLRRARELSFLCFTGNTLEALQQSLDPDHHRLLQQLDMLIDGPFQQDQQADLLWRGSTNQRIHLLTPRYGRSTLGQDAPGAGLEVHVSPQGRIFWAGVPPPGFSEQLSSLLLAQGIDLTETEGVWS